MPTGKEIIKYFIINFKKNFRYFVTDDFFSSSS